MDLYEIEWKNSARKELKKFDAYIAHQIIEKTDQLRENPFLGKPLGNKMGMNLTGCYKLMILKKKIRIVYKIVQKKLIIEVVSVGKRNNALVYKSAFQNL